MTFANTIQLIFQSYHTYTVLARLERALAEWMIGQTSDSRYRYCSGIKRAGKY